MRRAKTQGMLPRKMMKKLLTFYGCIKFENVHPLEGGFFRRKYRRDRRRGMPLENSLIFYPRYAWEILAIYSRFMIMLWRYRRICRRVERDNSTYEDLTLMPVQPTGVEELQLFTVTPAAKATADKARKKQAARKRIAIKTGIDT